MIVKTLLVLHVAILGYWLGAEFVINSTFRYVSRASAMVIADRSRLLDHVMTVDQHVRYALILQLGTGAALAGQLGYFAIGAKNVMLFIVATLTWLVLVEATHRSRHFPLGQRLAQADRLIRYLVILVLLVVGVRALSATTTIPMWLGIKLMLFAGVVACGVAIRFLLVGYFKTWAQIVAEGSNPVREAVLRKGYTRATSVLGVLWVLIVIIAYLSFRQP